MEILKSVLAIGSWRGGRKDHLRAEIIGDCSYETV